MICHYAVYLLRHRSIKTAQTGLHVSQGNTQLSSYECAGQCRVYIPNNDYEVGALLEANLLKFDHDSRRLLCMRPRSNSQIHVRLWQVELSEEDFRHPFIVVLAGMYQQAGDGEALDSTLVKLPQDRCNLHEVRPRSDHTSDFHHACAKTRSSKLHRDNCRADPRRIRAIR